jgi:acyl carrier protein
VNHRDQDDLLRHNRVANLVQQMLKERSIVQSIATDDTLIDAGLTSLDLVKLVFRVESEFDLTIPVCDITPDNFRTIGTIHGLVSRLLES